jgi:hypothetical protein
MTIRLKDIVLENTQNRVNLLKLDAIMEKLTPELTKAQNTKITELCAQVHEMVDALNKLPYTIFNHQEWNVLRLGLMGKLVEVKAEAEKLMGEGKVDVAHFIKELDELIVS